MESLRSKVPSGFRSCSDSFVLKQTGGMYTSSESRASSGLPLAVMPSENERRLLALARPEKAF